MELDRLHLPSNPELWVDMRRKVLWGDEGAVESAVFAVTQESGNRAQALHVLKRQRIFQLVEGWSLFLRGDGTVGMPDSAKPTPLPMRPESIDHLEPIDGNYLYAYAKHRFEVREDVGNPFDPASPAPSPASA